MGSAFLWYEELDRTMRFPRQLSISSNNTLLQLHNSRIILSLNQ